MTTESLSRKALEGVRVLDLSESESGAVAAQTLAWYGAEVVRIEEPGTGGQSRCANTDMPGVDGYPFIFLNCNKQSVTLDLQSEQGRQLLRRMIPRADILIEDRPPGTVERLGFSYQQVSAINPRIIYAQIKGFSPNGPYANYPSSETIAQAMGGVMSLTGPGELPPLKVGASIGGTGSGLLCLSGILAALYRRLETGLGRQVECSMEDVVLHYCRMGYAGRYYALRQARPRAGNRHTWAPTAPCNTYHCKPFGPNDYVYIFCIRGYNKHWERLLNAIGREDLLGDLRFATPEARFAHLSEVDELVGGWTRNYTKYEAVRIIGDGGVPIGMTLDTKELSEDPYLRQCGTFVTIRHPVRGEIVVPGWPVKMSEMPVEVTRPPMLGEHNIRVCREWLGLDEQEIAQLRADRVI
ncbi:MAG: CoA transferase [Candidatus Latescibacterota bacterium]